MLFKATSAFPHDDENADGNPAKIHLRTSPTVAFFNNLLYLFYVSGEKRNVFYATYNVANGTWSKPANLETKVSGVGVAINTSPYAVVFREKLYLFYQGYDENGTWYTTLNLSNTWSKLVSFNKSVNDGGIGQGDFLSQTSPSAAVHNNRLYLFWVSPPRTYKPTSGNIHYSSSAGEKWEPLKNSVVETWELPKPIELAKSGGGSASASDGAVVLQPTSPSAVSFGGTLHVFWNGGGGISFTTLEANGKWSPKALAPGAGRTAEPGTPYAFIHHYGPVEGPPSSIISTLRLVWTNNNDFCYSTLHKVNGAWGNVVAMQKQDDIAAAPSLGTFPCATAASHLGHFFFYADSRRTVQISKSIVYALEESMDTSEPTNDHLSAQPIIFSSSDSSLAAFVSNTMKTYGPPKIDAQAADEIVGKLVLSWNKRPQPVVPTTSLFGTLLYWVALSKGRRIVIDAKTQGQARVDIYISPFP